MPELSGLACQGWYRGSPQHKLAMEEYRSDLTVGALYGCSGRGYNMYQIITDLTAAKRRVRPLLTNVQSRTCFPKTETVSFRAGGKFH